VVRGPALHAVASALLRPRGPGYDPRLRLRRRAVALRGGDDAVVLSFSWEAGEVRIRVLATRRCGVDDVERAIDAGRGLAAIDDDPTDFLARVRRHPLLGPLAGRSDPRLARSPTVFESLAVAVVEQLVTGFEARASVRRLWRIAGEPVPGTNLCAPPTAAAVRRVPMWNMHAIGIGARRAATLHAASGRGEAIERLSAAPPEVFVDRLQSLRGIGPWTANAVARNALAWADAVPVGDFHAPFTISEALGAPPFAREDAEEANAAMLELLEPFRPHRARVALLLEGGLPTGAPRRWRLPRIDPHRREPWR
jgi:3-methyladenine DNA glycosylase/8-oxoguanine DNA glycosylase